MSVTMLLLVTGTAALLSLTTSSPLTTTPVPLKTQPEQIHISLTDVPSEMLVTWVTMNASGTPIAEYGINTFSKVAKGSTTKFIDGGKEQRKIFIHRVKLVNLKPAQKYLYRVGGSLGWSEVLTFVSLDPGTDWSPRVAFFGDMGNKNAQSLARLQTEVELGHFDAILHIGDFAYNMDTDNARFGDAFMNQIQPVAAYVPYMVSVGNHEEKYNFSNYKNRFTMPGGDGEAMFFSFNMGPVHFVSFSSEFYYYLEYGFTQVVNQYRWLEKDLQEANKPENRAKRPWIISMCHRPMYCSNSDDGGEHCLNKENIIRVGIPFYHDFSPEELLYKYGVDLHLEAHEHSYERLWPVYNLTVCNGSREAPYTNPRAPVHIVTGSSGCQEGVDPFVKVEQPWSAFQSDDYGYSRMIIHNDTHLYMEQVSDDKGGAVIDRMMLIKDHHGPDTFHCGG